MIPVLDLAIGVDFTNPTREESALLKDHIGFRLVTWLWVPMQIAVIFQGSVAFDIFFSPFRC